MRSFNSAAAALGYGAAGSVSSARGAVPLSNAPARGTLYTGGGGGGGGAKNKSLSARIMRLGASDSDESDDAGPPRSSPPKSKAPKGLAGFSPFGGGDDSDGDSF